MQTFLPWMAFAYCANVLDRKRLFKQSVECKQIISAILGISDGWKNHCITRMWQNDSYGLMQYWKAINARLMQLGMKYIDHRNIELDYDLVDSGCQFLGNDKFHSAYRSHLLAKDYDYYSSFNWPEQPESGYYAPNKDDVFVLYSAGKRNGEKL